MKKLTSKIALVASLLAVSGMFTIPAYGADEKPDAAKKAKEPVVTDAVLKKYDVNKNGKLDPDEEKAWKADLAKAKAEKKAEKKTEKKDDSK